MARKHECLVSHFMIEAFLVKISMHLTQSSQIKTGALKHAYNYYNRKMSDKSLKKSFSY
jgi:hypothetical protein